MELTKKATLRFRIEFLCLLALVALSALAENTTNCKKLNSKNSKSYRRKRWFSSLINDVKSELNKSNLLKQIESKLPTGLLKTGVTSLAKQIQGESKKQQSPLLKGIAEGIGLRLSKDFETCLEAQFLSIQDKVNPIISEYQKFFKDLKNVEKHLSDFTTVANLSVDAYNKIAECNKPLPPAVNPQQPQNASIFHNLLNVGVKFLKNQIKKTVAGNVDVALATEMAKHLTLINELKETSRDADQQAKGKLIGGLIKAVVDKRGVRRRMKLLRRRRL